MVFIPTSAFKNIMEFCDDRIEREQRKNHKIVTMMISIVRKDIEDMWEREYLDVIPYLTEESFEEHLMAHLTNPYGEPLTMFKKLDSPYLKPKVTKTELTFQGGLLVPVTKKTDQDIEEYYTKAIIDDEKYHFIGDSRDWFDIKHGYGTAPWAQYSNM